MTDRAKILASRLGDINAELGGRAKLIAVSKTYPKEDVALAYEAGQRDFGENKVQDLLDKAQGLEASCPDLRWHFIGSLQSNKINMLLKVPNLVSIHSIDSIKLLNKLLSKKLDKTPKRKIGLFLQYNTSGESEKGGFGDFEELVQAARMLNQKVEESATEGCGHFYLQGLMTMGAIRTDNFEKSAKECFDTLRGLKTRLESILGMDDLQLSMGMSSDYPIAIESGADWIRVGTSIFGAREY